MNREKVQAEITKVLSEVKQPSRKQYPVAKHQIATLTELGILDLMPAGFGYTDAAKVIETAQDAAGTKDTGVTVWSEGESVKSSGSALWKALNEGDATEPVAVTEYQLTADDKHKIAQIRHEIQMHEEQLWRVGHSHWSIKKDIQHNIAEMRGRIADIQRGQRKWYY